MLGVGFWKNGLGFFKLFLPSGVPWYLVPLIIPIEVIYAKESLNTTSAGFGILLASWGAPGRVLSILRDFTLFDRPVLDGRPTRVKLIPRYPSTFFPSLIMPSPHERMSSPLGEKMCTRALP